MKVTSSYILILANSLYRGEKRTSSTRKITSMLTRRRKTGTGNQSEDEDMPTNDGREMCSISSPLHKIPCVRPGEHSGQHEGYENGKRLVWTTEMSARLNPCPARITRKQGTDVTVYECNLPAPHSDRYHSAIGNKLQWKDDDPDSIKAWVNGEFEIGGVSGNDINPPRIGGRLMKVKRGKGLAHNRRR